MALTLKKLATPLLAASLLLPSLNAFAAAADPFDNGKPSALAMMTDLIILRPLGTAATIVGAAAYVVSLPFTLPTGSASEAGSVLVGEPAIYTFARCLGCTRPGYHPSVNNDEQMSPEDSVTE
ncbi:MAG TPA: hypothetical protein PKK14_07800 [Pseudomonadales bacterium]|nr:hypothetical protein [Pseudomonadales bacterium]